MADFDTAYNFMMDNEDFTRACKQVSDSVPAGCTGPCYAISGINSGSWPAQFAAISAMAQSDRGPAVEQFYHDNYWNDWFQQVASDEVGKRVFDFTVNGSSQLAVRTLQQAVNAVNAGGAQINEDGGWGPHTIAAVNAADPVALVTAFKAKRLAHYQAIAAANPDRQQYLKGWSIRAGK